jgi:glycosyltransferase involved in cell wall biosynthesis
MLADSKISVVLPYFNDSERIEKCLRSIIEQSKKPQEIIIVDDCSHDSDLLNDILLEIDWSSIGIVIKSYRNTENRNGAFSRNFALANLSDTTKYVAFLDADDFWDQNYLSNCLANIREHDLIYSDSTRLNLSEEVLEIKKATDIESLDNKFDLLLYSPPIINTLFFDVKILEKVRFDENLRRHQDYQFLMCVLMNNYDVAYYSFNSSFYVMSHRPTISRLNYSSMLEFWDRYRSFFSTKSLERKLLWAIFPVIPSSFIKTSELQLVKIYKQKLVLKLFLLSDVVIYRKVLAVIFVSIWHRDFSLINSFSIRKLISKYIKNH